MLAFSVMIVACGNSDKTNNVDAGPGGAIDQPLSLSGKVSTLAGMAPGTLDGAGTAARFNQIYAITTDGTNLYVADYSDSVIRKVVIETGLVTAFAGSARSSGSLDGTGSAARFAHPQGIASDGTNLFVADSYNDTIRKIVIATGEVSTLAGSAESFGSADGRGSAARFHYPDGITTDGTNLFIADNGNCTIRKVVIATADVTTLAGTAGVCGSADGTGPAARFGVVLGGLATDGTNLFVADPINDTIRKIVIASGEVTTFAGAAGIPGFTDGTGSSARFYGTKGITTDGTSLFVTDAYAVRKIVISTAAVTTVAGFEFTTGSADGTGTSASFNNPYGITTDGTSLFVTDVGNYKIRQVVIATGAVTTLAGAGSPGSTDGVGSEARFNGPKGITTDGTNLFVADAENHTIRKIEIATGAVSTLAGSAGIGGYADGTGSMARFALPSGIATDGTSLFVADYQSHTIRRVVIATGEVTTLAGKAWTAGSEDGAGSTARFNHPDRITTDGTNLFVTDGYNHTIRKVVIATAVVTTLAGSPGIGDSQDGTGSSASFHYPHGITTDGVFLFVADGNRAIRKIIIETGEVSTIVAGDTVSSNDLWSINAGITTDGIYLYVADSGLDRIAMLNIATGVVSTLAGDGQRNSTDGIGTAASFGDPFDITTDGHSLFVTDWLNNTIRKIT